MARSMSATSTPISSTGSTGVIVPESISGFGSTFDPHIADSVDLLTGTLPAQYGYRTSGVINLKTSAGAFDNGGDLSLYGGSRGTLEPSASIHGSSGGLNYFASGSYIVNDLGGGEPDCLARCDP